MIVYGAGQPVHSEEVDHMRKWRPRSYCESEVVFGAGLRPDSFMLRQRCKGAVALETYSPIMAMPESANVQFKYKEYGSRKTGGDTYEGRSK